jgi:hypothetical protein
MKLRTLFVAALALLVHNLHTASAQVFDDIRIYGYMQALAYNERQSTSLRLPNGQDLTQANDRTTFSLQQMNLFLTKPLGEQFTAFINLEFTRSYSSQRSWGSFSVEEAWVSYAGSEAFNVKAGLLLPTFNNLNELKNRTPLLPYLFRPPVYETNLSSILSFEDFLPERAYIQVSGSLPITQSLGGLRFDYAVHAGNSETSYISTNSNTSRGSAAASGEDSSPFKAFGGRVGMRNAAETFKLGISGTYDRDNKRDSTQTLGSAGSKPIPPLGDVPRVRVGADLSFSIGNFAFESEYIGVFHDVQYPSGSQANLNKFFYYGTLLYNITDRLYVYGNYSYFNQESATPDSPAAKGFDIFGGGAGYRITDVVIAKAQYSRVQTRTADFKLGIDSYYLGLSVIF